MYTDKPLPVNPPAGRTFHLPATGTAVYTAGQPQESKTMVILLTNSLGLTSINNRRLADRVSAKLGCAVVVPDLFEGEPVTTGGAVLEDGSGVEPSVAGAIAATAEAAIRSQDPQQQNPRQPSLLSLVKTFAVSTVKGFLEDMWSARHTFEHTLPLVQATVTEILSVYHPEKVAVLGYSFGAKYALHLLSKDLPAKYKAQQWADKSSTTSTDGSSSETAPNGLLDCLKCGVVVHPSLLEASDFKDVVKPVHIIYGKDDELLSEDLIRKGLHVLSEKEPTVPVETTVYDNEAERAQGAQPLPHGFAVPGDYPESIVGDLPDKVFSVVTAWISENL